MLLPLLLILPFPQDDQDEAAEQRGVVLKTEAATEGYTLFAPLASQETYLVDLDGKPVHRWDHDSNPASMVYLKDNGNLIRGGHHEGTGTFEGGGMGGVLEEFTWDGERLWQLPLNTDEFHQHHDCELLPNGNLLVIGWEAKSRDEAIARGRDPHTVDERGLWPDVIREYKLHPPAAAEVVWEWHSWDHLIQDFHEDRAGFGSIPDAPGRIDINGDHRDQPPLTAEERKRRKEIEEQMRALGYANGGDEDEEEEDESEEDLRRLRSPDWLHTNAVAYLPEHDLIALSTPEFGEIWIIDHSTSTEEAAGTSGGTYGRGGDILWRWGNPRTYGAGKGRDQKLFYQHDPTWQVDEEGKVSLLLFNNGGGRPGKGEPFSEVMELDLPFDAKRGFDRGEDSAFGPQAPRWSYTDPGNFFAPFISGAQRLPSGNTLICAGPEGRLFEVTPGGEVVWDYLNDLGGEHQFGDHHPEVPPHAIFRAHRYSAEHPALKGRL